MEARLAGSFLMPLSRNSPYPHLAQRGIGRKLGIGLSFLHQSWLAPVRLLLQGGIMPDVQFSSIPHLPAAWYSGADFTVPVQGKVISHTRCSSTHRLIIVHPSNAP
jgi:hypothetical protein